MCSCAFTLQNKPSAAAEIDQTNRQNNSEDLKSRALIPAMIRLGSLPVYLSTAFRRVHARQFVIVLRANLFELLSFTAITTTTAAVAAAANAKPFTDLAR